MNWYQKIWKPKTIIIVFFEFNTQGVRYSAIKKSVISKKDATSPMNFDSLDDVIKHFGQNTPYFFHVLGKGVLSRKIELTKNFKNNLIINGNSEDFIFSSFHGLNHIASSFFRKVLIEDELSKSSKAIEIDLLGINCGEAILFTLLGNQRIELNTILEKREGEIVVFSKNPNPIDNCVYQGQRVTAVELTSKAIIDHLIQKNDSYSSSNNEVDKTSFENYAQKTQFKVFGLVILSTIFTSLLINYFYQNILNSQIAQLELELSVSNENLSMLDRLEQEKYRKEKLIINAGVNSTKFLSFYLNEIAKTVPSEIQLVDLDLFPLSGKLKNKRKIEVNQHQIIIQGVTQGNIAMDDWMERMDRFDWVKSVELINYMNNSEDGNSIFTLSITLL